MEPHIQKQNTHMFQIASDFLRHGLRRYLLIKAIGNCLGKLENTNFTFWLSSHVQVLCTI